MKLKFRAWDKEFKEMYDVDMIRFFSGIIEVDNESDHQTDKISKYEVMQFTGITDKNGKEIFEGDILRLLNSDVLCEVYYEAPSFCRRWLNSKVSNVRGVEMESMAHNTHIAYEVIGNIYEHKHLLEENENENK